MVAFGAWPLREGPSECVGLGAAGAGLDRLAVLVEHHAGLVEHLLVGEDRHFRAHSEGDSIARARVNLPRAAVDIEDDAGVEGVVGKVADEDVVHPRAERLDVFGDGGD